MYEEHPSFKSIADETKIWRFMDFTKFCAILENKSLFFTKPEKFIDPWEGYLPKRHYQEESYGEAPYGTPATHIQHADDMAGLVRSNFAVNCWHINNSESEAFWRNYSGRGVAIQTTFRRLKESFNHCDDYAIFIGEVEYKDHEVDLVDIGNLFNAILWKRKSFEYEKELRAVIWESANYKGRGARSFDNINGQDILVDLNVLIENIYTTPFEEGVWFRDLVNDIMKRYGLESGCIKSTLMDSPRS